MKIISFYYASVRRRDADSFNSRTSSCTTEETNETIRQVTLPLLSHKSLRSPEQTSVGIIIGNCKLFILVRFTIVESRADHRSHPQTAHRMPQR